MVRRASSLGFAIRCGSLLLGLTLASGCASANKGEKSGLEEFVKAFEHQSWDELARFYSAYCADVHDKGPWVDRTRIEFAREIRQSAFGHFGPIHPGRHVASILEPEAGEAGTLDAIPDQKTRMARGPIVMIYCQGDDVPDDVWRGLERPWRD